MGIAISVVADYKKYIKKFYLEEPLDYLLFRPLAYVFIKITYSLPLNPNHYSFLSLVSSIFAGYNLSTGSANGFVLGGLGIFLFCIFDCCDGMIARMKKNGSKYGDLIDMFVDLLSNISFFTGLYLGLSKSEEFYPFQYLTIVSAILILLHASIYNFYKKQYSFYMGENPDGRNKEIEYYKRERERLRGNKGHYFSKLIISMFLLFSSAQKDEKSRKIYDIQKYQKLNKQTLPMWGIIAGSSHLGVLSIALMTHRLGIFFLFTIILFNLWAFFVTVIQRGINKSIEVVA